MRGIPIPRIAISPMSFCLSSNRHAAAIGDRLVILDVATDRYLGLGPSARDALDALARREFSHPGIHRLRSLGIVEAGEWRPPYLDAVLPLSSALETEPTHARSPHFLGVATAIVRSMSELRWRGLSWALGALERQAPPQTAADPAVIGLAQSFSRHRSRLPFKNICLAESLALHAVLSRRGFGTDVVIGVRLNPFGAHCWLQQGEFVLNDNCDHVSQFTPILIA